MDRVGPGITDFKSPRPTLAVMHLEASGEPQLWGPGRQGSPWSPRAAPVLCEPMLWIYMVSESVGCGLTHGVSHMSCWHHALCLFEQFEACHPQPSHSTCAPPGREFWTTLSQPLLRLACHIWGPYERSGDQTQSWEETYLEPAGKRWTQMQDTRTEPTEKQP